jgi:hypothetical protein
MELFLLYNSNHIRVTVTFLKNRPETYQLGSLQYRNTTGSLALLLLLDVELASKGKGTP